MVRFKIREILEKHLERTLTDDEILIFNTAYSYGQKDSFKVITEFIGKQLED